MGYCDMFITGFTHIRLDNHMILTTIYANPNLVRNQENTSYGYVNNTLLAKSNGRFLFLIFENFRIGGMLSIFETI